MRCCRKLDWTKDMTPLRASQITFFCFLLSACEAGSDYGRPVYTGNAYDSGYDGLDFAGDSYYGGWGDFGDGFDGWGGYGRGFGGMHHGFDHSGWSHSAGGHALAGGSGIGGHGFGGHSFGGGGGHGFAGGGGHGGGGHR
jgi:hypothetical protein